MEGFENRIAELIARDLKASLHYTWWVQRRDLIQHLAVQDCDLVMSVPAHVKQALATEPYYRSSYVFLSRRDQALNLRSFDDPILRRIRVGVQLTGDDSGNTPPAYALSNRKIVNNVSGFAVSGGYLGGSPSRIVDAVVKGEIDVAIVWGPVAGYYAKQEITPLDLVPVSPQIDRPFLPFVFDISIGVKKGETALCDEIQSVMTRRQTEIRKILDDYGIPVI